MDDSILINQIHEGGKQKRIAISQLYRKYYDEFYRYYCRNGLPTSDAEDLVQEVFVLVVRKIDNYRGDCPVGGWLWRIARNTLIDRYRKKKPETSSDHEVLEYQMILSGKVASNINTDDLDIQKCIQRGFGEFAKEHNERAQVLTLVCINEWTISDVSHFLNRTPGATREFISQCRKKLQPYILHCLEIIMAV